MADTSETSRHRRIITLVAVGASAVLVIGIGIATSIYISRHVTTSGEPPPGATATTTSKPRDDSAHAGPDGYAADFEHDTHGWSRSVVSRTPKGKRPFLGQFSHDVVTFKVSQLAPHKMLRIRFSFLAINTLDGSGHDGPDIWAARIVGGPTLVRATFSNLPDTQNFAFDGKIQSYPAPIPSFPSARGTGASAVNELGFVYHFSGVTEEFPMDAEYPMDMTIPHTGDELTLEFQGRGMGALDDEGWGLSDFKIDTVTTEPAPPGVADLKRWFAEVCGNDEPLAHRSFWNLVAAGDAAVAFLESESVAPGFNRQDVMQRVSVLRGGAKGDAQVEATNDLAAMGPGVEPLIAAEANAYADPAILDVLEHVELRPILDADARRSAAKARLLAVINTPQAQQVYGAWVASAPAWAPDWKRRFDAVYHVAEGEHLVYVPTPFIPERQRYLTERVNLVSTSGIQVHYDFNPRGPSAAETGIILLPRESTTEFQTRAYLIRPSDDNASTTARGVARPASTLEQLVQQMAGTQRKKPMPPVNLTPELNALTLPGDWIIGKSSTPDQMLEDLANILDQHTDEHVRFALRDVGRQGYDVSGTYEFNGAATQPAKTPGAVLVFADEANSDSGSGVWNAPATSALQLIARRFDVPMKMPKTITGAPKQISWQLDRSSAPLPGDVHSDENTARLKKILDNIALQTGLTITPSTVHEKAYVVEPR